VLAERSGLRIAEVPVDWIDDPDSRVDIVSTAVADLRGVARVARALVRGDLPVRELREQLGRGSLEVPGVPNSLARQAIRFGVVGALSTLAYLLLFMLARPLGAQPANLVALLVTAVANTAANRRFTFGVSGDGAARQQLQGLVVFALGLVLTSGSLALLTDLVAHPARLLELSVLVAANLAATVLRFVLFREWVFARRTSSVTPPPEGSR
jgi:putative flippase GtrA